MAVDAVSATTTTATSASRGRLAQNFDTFLALLTTQLKNQDPTSPMDSTQFTQQLTQMTGVEQQLLTNDLLTKLVSNTGSGVSTAVSLIGKDIRAEADTAQLSKGKAEWGFSLARDAADVKMEILDEKGRVVRTMTPTKKTAGEQVLTWDGKATGGGDLPDGTYSLKITAKDSQGSTVTSKTFVDGRVTGVEQMDGSTFITVNGVKIPWDKLVSIRQPKETETAASGVGSTTTTTDDKTSSPAAA